MENIYFLHVIKFLLPWNALSLLWERTVTQRKLKRTDESIVWGQVTTIYICMSVMEVHGDKSEIVHLALVLLPLSYCNMVLGVDCRTLERSCKYNFLLMLSSGQEGYQGLTEHLNLPKNLHEAKKTGKNMRRAPSCSGSGWELETGCETVLTLSSNSVPREPLCLRAVTSTATLVASHLLC